MNIISKTFPYLVCLIESFFLYDYCDRFLKKTKYNALYKALFLLFFLAIQRFIFSMSGNTFIRFFASSIPDFLYILFAYEREKGKKLFIFFSFSFFLVSTQALAICASGYYYQGINLFTSAYTKLRIGQDLLYLLLLVILIVISTRFQDANDRILCGNSWFLLILTPCISFLVIFFFYPFSDGIEKGEELLIAISIAFLLINLLIFKFYEIVTKEKLHDIENIALGRALRQNLNQADQMILSMKEKNELLHDYKKNLLVVKAYLKNEQVSQAEQYVSTLLKEIKKRRNMAYTGNILIDFLIAGYLGEHNNIFIYGNLPKELPMDVRDMACLFGNAFENAGKFCRKEDRIEIHFLFDDRILKCLLKNPTTQGDESSSGLGIPIMTSITRKYDGEIEIYQKKNIFTLFLYIPL